jgi:hypothetical protein
MRPIIKLTSCFLLLALCYVSSLAQTSDANKSAESAKQEERGLSPEPIIRIHLMQGEPVVVDEVNESADGYWYKRGNVSTFIDRAKVKNVERVVPVEEAPPGKDAVAGNGRWRLADAARVKDFFLATFNRPLPLSAFGQSDLHDRWGWDHRNGMDVGLHPDSREGRVLIAFLREQSIPFLAFRSAIPGIATGPHIHIGNRSPRIASR